MNALCVWGGAKRALFSGLLLRCSSLDARLCCVCFTERKTSAFVGGVRNTFALYSGTPRFYQAPLRCTITSALGGVHMRTPRRGAGARSDATGGLTGVNVGAFAWSGERGGQSVRRSKKHITRPSTASSRFESNAHAPNSCTCVMSSTQRVSQ